MPDTTELVKRLRDLHDRLHCLVTPYGVYKTSHDKELECEAASHECWSAADAIEALQDELAECKTDRDRAVESV